MEKEGLGVVCISCDRDKVRIYEIGAKQEELENAGWVPYKGGWICINCQQGKQDEIH
jgi:hypothetical protein